MAKDGWPCTGVPVLGVNHGQPWASCPSWSANELERLRDLASWDFTVEYRMMLDVTVLREGKPVYNNIALNDAVISKGGRRPGGAAGCIHGGGPADQDHRRRGHCVHAHRIHGRTLWPAGGAHRGAHGSQSAADAHLPPLDPGGQLRALARSTRCWWKRRTPIGSSYICLWTAGRRSR